MSCKGKLIIFSGPSGAGKGTVLKEYFKLHPETAYSVSATTRKPRSGEVDGVDYFFLTREKFTEMIANDDLLEYAEYSGNYYGTPKSAVFEKLEKGINVILEIEVQGARKVMDAYPEVTSIFITPPSVSELKKRLSSRGTEDPDEIKSRLKAATGEIARVTDYDYIIVNDKVEKAAEQLHKIITAQKYTQTNIEELLNEVLQNA